MAHLFAADHVTLRNQYKRWLSGISDGSIHLFSRSRYTARDVPGETYGLQGCDNRLSRQRCRHQTFWHFGQRDRLQDQMSQVSSVYNSIMDKITQRRQVVEDQLKKIEAEIRFMTMKARLEERQRLRAEREQSFRETYFDTRTSEFEEK